MLLYLFLVNASVGFVQAAVFATARRMSDLAEMRKANEEKMARLKAMQEADDAPAATRVVSTVRRVDAAPAVAAALTLNPEPAPAPAIAARPSRMGAVPARMAATVKPPTSAVAPAARTAPALTLAPAQAPSALPPSSLEAARRPSFAIRGNTFNASDLFGSLDEEDEPLPPPKGYTGPLARGDGLLPSGIPVIQYSRPSLYRRCVLSSGQLVGLTRYFRTRSSPT